MAKVKYRAVIEFESEQELTGEQVNKLIETCLPVNTDIEVWNDDNTLQYICIDTLTLNFAQKGPA